MADDRASDAALVPAGGPARPVLDRAVVATIVDSAPDGILLVDDSGRIVFANPCTRDLFGYDPDDLVGEPVEVLVPDDVRSAHTAYRARYGAHPTARPMGAGLALAGRRRDGSRLPVEISLSPVDTATGRFTVAIVRDVSERVRAEAELRAAREELALVEDRERIARDLHDTVLQRIFATGLTLQGTAARVPTPELRERIESAVAELDTAIRDIRTAIFSLHATSQPGALRQRTMAIAAEAARVLGFSPVVRFEGPVDTAVVEEAGEALLAVLRETLSNVARHARASRVEVDVEVKGRDGLTLRVADDGVGLSGDCRQVGGRGLANIEERARALGGSCDIGPGPAGGTVARWWVPLRP
jgi:two-component system sensor histidine kinase DevS